MKKIFLILGMLLCLGTFAMAQDKDKYWESGEYANSEDINNWYRDLMQPDNKAVSCCGVADAYYADSFEVDCKEIDGQRVCNYVAIITDTRKIPNRPEIPVGTKIVVPNHKLKFDQGNPTGHGVIFVNSGSRPMNVYCYLPPGGV